MASIIPGYEYDIFISYRQKDNKGDKWVSEFVGALKDELESTFKEEISVYFDINPHDGLLETHDVDASLKEKLKCLVFIPIISRTYCDPRSFAWGHEFVAFVEQASRDHNGLKVKLPGGNVASRVLPVIIHDLDKKDIKLCESVIGGVLRGIEFIYSEPGVNKPLIAIDDEKKNLNNTIYRIQINKVANAIKDVLNSLTTIELSGEDNPAEAQEVADNKSISTKSIEREKAQKVFSVSILYKLKNLIALSRKTWPIAALILLISAVSLVSFWLARRSAPIAARALFTADIPLSSELSYTGRKSIALSPAGDLMVYVMNGELNLKSLNNNASPVPIPGTGSARSPFFMNDGKWIGFDNRNDSKIMKVPVLGGSAITICDLERMDNGISWHKNKVIFALGASIYSVTDLGGTPELLYPLTQSEDDLELWNPQMLPDNLTLLFSQENKDGSWSIMTWKLGSKENPVTIIKRGRDGRYLNSGHIAYSNDKYLYVSKFDPRKNRIISDPQVITTNPLFESTFSGASQFDFSDNGILVYYGDHDLIDEKLVSIDRSGAITSISRETKIYTHISISSDNTLIAAEVTFHFENFQIEIINTLLGTSSLFIEDAEYPVWSNDNSSIIYIADENQIFQKPINLSAPPKLISNLDSIFDDVRLGNLSSNGRYLSMNARSGNNNRNIGYYDMINHKVVMLEHYNTKSNETSQKISPDGKWIAFYSDYDGGNAIYIAPFPGPGPKMKVTLDNFATSRLEVPIVWAHDMKALYYIPNFADYEIWEVKVQNSENNLSTDIPKSIFNGDISFSKRDFDIFPDDGRFLGIRQIDATQEEIEFQLVVMANWEQELDDNR